MAMSTDGAGEPQVYTAADDGTAIEVRVGETITVDLAGNPTTGHAWQVEVLDPAVMTATSPAYETDSELMGAGGTFTFTFTAVAAGETQLRLVYLRPWEHGAPRDLHDDDHRSLIARCPDDASAGRRHRRVRDR